MSWGIVASVGVGLLGASEQRKANSQARDAADKTNTSNNALRDQAMPYALENLKTNAALQKFYQQNPFNQQQKTGYQNQNNLIDNFNGQVAPGLLGMANGMMGQQYQRQRGGAPGSGAGYGGPMQAAGMQPNAGLLAGPFSAPQQQAFGRIDFDKMNPFQKTEMLAGDVGPPNPNQNPQQHVMGGRSVNDAGFSNELLEEYLRRAM